MYRFPVTIDGSVVFNSAVKDTYLHQNLTPTGDILDFNDGVKCNISFNISNYSGSGTLTFRLYNNNGEGFEHDISADGQYNLSGIIGNSDTNDSTLYNRFGFYVSSDDTFSGTVDSVYLSIDGEGSGKTITYNEKSKGWVSFKSFIPELGVSSVNQYYTFNNGQLWKHHTNETRNTFFEIDRDWETKI